MKSHTKVTRGAFGRYTKRQREYLQKNGVYAPSVRAAAKAAALLSQLPKETTDAALNPEPKYAVLDNAAESVPAP